MRTLAVSFLSLVIVGAANAQESSDVALAAILGDEVRTSQDLERRQTRVREWLAAHDEQIPEGSLVRAIARYHLDGKQHAGSIWEHVRDHGVESEPLRREIGRVLMFHGCELAEQGAFDECTRLVPTAIGLGAEPMSMYWLIGRRARDAGTEQGSEYLQDVVIPWILAEHRLTDAERVFVLRRLYDVEYDGPRPFVHISGRTLDGETVSTRDYRGRVLLVDYWATWCVPCLQSLPEIAEIAGEYGEQGFEVLGVSIDDAGLAAKVRAAAEKGGATWPQIYEGLGGQQPLALDNGVRSIPGLFLLDRTGRCRYTDLHGDELRRRIEELLAEKP